MDHPHFGNQLYYLDEFSYQDSRVTHLNVVTSDDIRFFCESVLKSVTKLGFSSSVISKHNIQTSKRILVVENTRIVNIL